MNFESAKKNQENLDNIMIDDGSSEKSGNRDFANKNQIVSDDTVETVITGSELSNIEMESGKIGEKEKIEMELEISEELNKQETSDEKEVDIDHESSEESIMEFENSKVRAGSELMDVERVETSQPSESENDGTGTENPEDSVESDVEEGVVGLVKEIEKSVELQSKAIEVSNYGEPQTPEVLNQPRFPALIRPIPIRPISLSELMQQYPDACCRHCSIIRPKREMTRINLRNYEFLGRTIGNNILMNTAANPPPHYLCNQHIRDLMLEVYHAFSDD